MSELKTEGIRMSGNCYFYLIIFHVIGAFMLFYTSFPVCHEISMRVFISRVNVTLSSAARSAAGVREFQRSARWEQFIVGYVWRRTRSWLVSRNGLDTMQIHEPTTYRRRRRVMRAHVYIYMMYTYIYRRYIARILMCSRRYQVGLPSRTRVSRKSLSSPREVDRALISRFFFAVSQSRGRARRTSREAETLDRLDRGPLTCLSLYHTSSVCLVLEAKTYARIVALVSRCV